MYQTSVTTRSGEFLRSFSFHALQSQSSRIMRLTSPSSLEVSDFSRFVWSIDVSGAALPGSEQVHQLRQHYLLCETTVGDRFLPYTRSNQSHATFAEVV